MKELNQNHTVVYLFKQAFEKKIASDLSENHKNNLPRLYTHFMVFLGPGATNSGVFSSNGIFRCRLAFVGEQKGILDRPLIDSGDEWLMESGRNNVLSYPS